MLPTGVRERESESSWGEGGVEAGLIGKKTQGEVGIQLRIQLYIVFPPHLKVFTEQAGHEQDMLLEAWGGEWKW